MAAATAAAAHTASPGVVPSLPVQTALRVRTPDPHCWLHSENSLS